MATTSLWRITGRIDGVVNYVENPDKTSNPKFTAQNDLANVIDYAMRQAKTEQIQTDNEGVEIMCQFVTGINCSPETASEEMLAVKRRFGKEDGTVAYHGYQSFAPGEATPEIVHEIGVKLAQRLWGERYQVLVATHLDRENHLHSHFVINTVSFVDGIKFHRTAKDYHDMQTISDELCREYGLSVIENPQRGKSKNYGEWRAEQDGHPTWRGLIRADVDEAIQQSMTERQFLAVLKSKGYEVKLGQDISVRPPGKERFFRLVRNFGNDYTIESIRRRILSHGFPERTVVPEKKVQNRKLKGKFSTQKKATGLRALYFHYCYLMGIFPRKNQRQNNKQVHFLLREDMLKLDAITAEARLLARCRIDTGEQLLSYKSEVLQRIESLSGKRKSLQNLLRMVDVKSNSDKTAEIKNQISELSTELKKLKREVHLCDDIAQRSQEMSDKLQILQNEKDSQNMEVKKHEYVR